MIIIHSPSCAVVHQHVSKCFICTVRAKGIWTHTYCLRQVLPVYRPSGYDKQSNMTELQTLSLGRSSL